MKFYLIAHDGLAEENPLFSELENYKEYLQNHADLVDRASRAEGILVLGGDGTMLKAIRKHSHLEIPFYGLNFGHVGFLMNDLGETVLLEIIEGRIQFVDAPMLKADLYDAHGEIVRSERAFNDFYFERASTQTSKIRVVVDGNILFDPLICDGVIVATAAGSTAYNASARGEIIPVGTNSMVLTGICPMRFYKWHSAQLPHDAHVVLEAIDVKKRPVRFLADGVYIRNVVRAEISYSTESVKIGFVTSQNFREKVMKLQFMGGVQ